MLYGALAKEHKKDTNKQFSGGHYYLTVTGIILGIMLPNCNCSFHCPIITMHCQLTQTLVMTSLSHRCVCRQISLWSVYFISTFFCTSGTTSISGVYLHYFCRSEQKKERILLNSSSTGSPRTTGATIVQVQSTEVRWRVGV